MRRVLTIVVVLLSLAGCGGSHATRRAQIPTVSPSPTPSPSLTPKPSSTGTGFRLPPGASFVVQANGHALAIYDQHGRRRWQLPNPNSLGAPLVLLVIDQHRAGSVHVYVPVRPNGATGWVRNVDVTMFYDPYRLAASESRHRLTVFKYGKAIARFPIAVGRPTAPTPTGMFFLTELLQATKPGPYGPYAYGLSAFSSVYSEFEGGPGQIGLHGTSDPSSIGHSVSHGCIRLFNSDMAKIAKMVPAGTPITITS